MTWERAMWPAEPAETACDARGITEAQLKNRYGIHVKWSKRRFLTTETADRIACRVLGLHPTALWGQAWLDAVPADEQQGMEELWAVG